jgi:hypothetical protein
MKDLYPLPNAANHYSLGFGHRVVLTPVEVYSQRVSPMNRRLQSFSRNLAPLAAVLALSAINTTAARAADCDRTCLKGMITKYVDAIVAHDPSHLPLAANVRFTEDSKELKLGDGLWKTIAKKGDFCQDYIDAKKQIAALHVQLPNRSAAPGRLRHSAIRAIVSPRPFTPL